jgi:predicted permease
MNRSWINRLLGTLRGRRLQDDLDSEVAFHVDQRTADLIAQGVDPARARSEAELAFGNRTLAKESARERDIFVWLETALQDLRYAARMLRRSPGFTATAVISLALGIGANTALFSLLDVLLIRLLPVAEPDRLIRISATTPGGATDSLPYPLLERIRRESTLLSGVLAMTSFREDIQENGSPVPARVEVVSGEYFDVLGIGAIRGRVFHLSEVPYGAPSLAVISDSFWRSHYSARDAVLGEQVRVGQHDYTIAGIAAPGFRGARIDWPVDVWIPVEQAIPPTADQRKHPNWGWLVLLGRLAPGATEAAAYAEAEAIFHRHLEDIAGRARFDHPQQRDALFSRHVVFRPGATGISGIRDRYSRPLLVIAAIAATVLLIACANLANLLLARGTSREREIAVRQALGAGGARLARQFLTESLLLAALGGIAALFLARWLNAAMLRFLPDDLSASLGVLAFKFDWRMIAFTAALAVATCLLFGLAPALRGTKTAGSREHTESRTQAWTGRALVAAEIAMCTLLLMGCGLFVRTLWKLRTLDAGFARTEILTATIGSGARDYTPERAQANFEDLRARIATLPGVRAVGYAVFGLMIGDRTTADVDVEGRPVRAGEDLVATEMRISPGYLDAMGTPLLGGRGIGERDVSGAPQVALVNETFAQKFFKGESPLGRHFGLDGPKSAGTIEIVGVVKDVKYQDLREKPAPIFYRAFRQAQHFGGMVLAIRSPGDLSAIASGLRGIAKEIDPRLTVRQPRTFASIIDRTLLGERMVATFSTALGLLALLVACVGLYGVLAYRVARRTREIGVRIALGASANGVQKMVLGESLLIFALGAAIGVPLALAMTRLIASLLFDVAPHDVVTMSATLAVLAIVSLAAAWLPARRAARVDPMTALRCD